MAKAELTQWSLTTLGYRSYNLPKFTSALVSLSPFIRAEWRKLSSHSGV